MLKVIDPRSAAGLFVLAGCFAVAVPACAAPSRAAAIYNGMAHLYKSATSYHGVCVIRVKQHAGGKGIVTVVTQNIQYKKPNQLRLEADITVSGARPQSLHTLEIYDGHDIWQYSRVRNQYMHTAAAPRAKPIQLTNVLRLPLMDAASLKMLPPDSRAGQPVDVISGLTQIEPGVYMPPEVKKKVLASRRPVTIMVDRRTHQLVRILESNTYTIASADYSGQSIGGPIAPSAFHFAIPKGSTEFKRPVGPPKGTK